MTLQLQILNISFFKTKKIFSYNLIKLAIFGDGEGKKKTHCKQISQCVQRSLKTEAFDEDCFIFLIVQHHVAPVPAQYKSQYQKGNVSPVRTYRKAQNMPVWYSKSNLYKLPLPNKS